MAFAAIHLPSLQHEARLYVVYGVFVGFLYLVHDKSMGRAVFTFCIGNGPYPTPDALLRRSTVDGDSRVGFIPDFL